MPADEAAAAWAGIAVPAQAPPGRPGRGGKKPGKEKAIHRSPAARKGQCAEHGDPSGPAARRDASRRSRRR